jgi:hypothetical protein
LPALARKMMALNMDVRPCPPLILASRRFWK